MAPVVERELRITYGAFVVGGTSNYLLDAGDDGRDRIKIDRTFSQTVVEFYVLTADHATDAAFAAACTAIESAFTRPRLRLLVEQGDLSATPSTLLDLNPATDTGIDVEATCRKVGGDADTGRSRRYFVRVVSGSPANQTATIAGEAGLRSFRSSVRYLPSRLRVLEVSGTYTKLASNTAEQQYLAQIDTRVGAITDALTGEWDLTDERRQPNLEGSLVEFSRTYEELNLKQSLSALDDPNVARQQLRVAIAEEAPGDSGGDVLRLVAVDVAYEAWINKSVTDLRAWWTSTGLPWVVAHARATARASAVALVGRAVNYDDGRNLIQAQLRFLTATGGKVLSRTIVQEDRIKAGNRFVPVWNGDPEAAYVFPGPREVYRVEQVIERELGANPLPAAGGGRGARPGNVFGIFGIGQGLQLDFGGMGVFGIGSGISLEFLGPEGLGGGAAGGNSGSGGVPPGVSGYVLVESSDRRVVLTLGLPGATLDVTDVVKTSVKRRITGVAANGGGNGAQSGAGGSRPRAAQPGGAP